MSKTERKCNRWVDVLRSVGLHLSCIWAGCIFQAEGRRQMSRSCSRFCNRKNCRSQKWKHFSSFQSLSFLLLLVCLNLWSCSHQSSSIKISPSLYPISSHFLPIWLNLFDQDHKVLPPPYQLLWLTHRLTSQHLLRVPTFVAKNPGERHKHLHCRPVKGLQTILLWDKPFPWKFLSLTEGRMGQGVGREGGYFPSIWRKQQCASASTSTGPYRNI